MNSDSPLILNQNIIGRQVGDGWTVTEFIPKTPDHSGGVYSKCYKLEKDGEVAFMKAYDLEQYASHYKDKDRADIYKLMLEHYTYERDLLLQCRGGYLENVCYATGSGEIGGADLWAPFTPYLIFDKADEDLRSLLFRDVESLPLPEKFKLLHDVAVGLQQLKTLEIHHQDLKPSNVLKFPHEYKVADLGRSYTPQLQCPFVADPVWGDKTYLAPEIAYRHNVEDVNERAAKTDLYLMGSLIYQTFTKTCFTAALNGKLDSKFHSSQPDVRYESILPQLIEAHACVMESFQEGISNLNLPEKVSKDVVEVIRYLCHPDYRERRYPTDDPGHYNHATTLRKIVAALDLMHKRVLNASAAIIKMATAL